MITLDPVHHLAEEDASPDMINTLVPQDKLDVDIMQTSQNANPSPVGVDGPVASPSLGKQTGNLVTDDDDVGLMNGTAAVSSPTPEPSGIPQTTITTAATASTDRGEAFMGTELHTNSLENPSQGKVDGENEMPVAATAIDSPGFGGDADSGNMTVTPTDHAISGNGASIAVLPAVAGDSGAATAARAHGDNNGEACTTDGVLPSSAECDKPVVMGGGNEMPHADAAADVEANNGDRNMVVTPVKHEVTDVSDNDGASAVGLPVGLPSAVGDLGFAAAAGVTGNYDEGEAFAASEVQSSSTERPTSTDGNMTPDTATADAAADVKVGADGCNMAVTPKYDEATDVGNNGGASAAVLPPNAENPGAANAVGVAGDLNDGDACTTDGVLPSSTECHKPVVMGRGNEMPHYTTADAAADVEDDAGGRNMATTPTDHKIGDNDGASTIVLPPTVGDPGAATTARAGAPGDDDGDACSTDRVLSSVEDGHKPVAIGVETGMPHLTTADAADGFQGDTRSRNMAVTLQDHELTDVGDSCEESNATLPSDSEDPGADTAVGAAGDLNDGDACTTDGVLPSSTESLASATTGGGNDTPDPPTAVADPASGFESDAIAHQMDVNPDNQKGADDENAMTKTDDYLADHAAREESGIGKGLRDPAVNGAQPHKGRVDVHVILRWWKARELSLVPGSVLRLCAIRRGHVTESCKEISLDRSSEVVILDGERRDGRSPFRVTTGAPRGKSNTMWQLDAGSPEAREAWVALVERAIDEARVGAEDVESGDDTSRATNMGATYSLGYGPIRPHTAKSSLAFRGNTLSSGDEPLRPRQFLSNLPNAGSANLQVTEIGDIVLRRGDLPAYPTDGETLWAHRATGSIGGKANGGLGCVIEGWWTNLAMGTDADIPVHLGVKNGRWRVGRGRLCTMGRSPKPKGSWRVFLPWDARGKAIKTSSLRVEDDTVVVASGEEVMWRSPPPRKGRAGGRE